jgi:DNA-binding FrmR family transcriptional regulator
MHDSEIAKLNRIAGQVEGIKKMITDGRHCPDILTQLRAVRSAVKTVEANILETHLNHCITESLAVGNIKDAKEKIDELKDLFKRFD